MTSIFQQKTLLENYSWKESPTGSEMSYYLPTLLIGPVMRLNMKRMHKIINFRPTFKELSIERNVSIPKGRL